MAKIKAKQKSALKDGNKGFSPSVSQTRKLKSRVNIAVTPGLK